MESPVPTIPANTPDNPDSPHTVGILSVIQDALNKITGCTVPITHETRIDQYFKEVAGADPLDYIDLSFQLEKSLGVWISDEDWAYLVGGSQKMTPEEWEVKYAELFTFGRLADLVASRARFGKVKEVTILGATSKSAGAFRKIEEIVGDYNPRLKPFGPSTQIHERLQGRALRVAWAKLRALSQNRIPPLLPTRLEKTADYLYGSRGVLLVLILTGIAFKIIGRLTGLTANSGWGVWFLTLLVLGNCIAGAIAACAYTTVVALRRIGKINDKAKLPKGINTFRDLAELISGDRGGWCTKCEYDLTGVESGICPECGTPINPNPLQWAKSDPKP